jgi:2,4-dienoyl-CoA reductase-like NADH-dependent reductase (Old Yellow Enzyme family)
MKRMLLLVTVLMLSVIPAAFADTAPSKDEQNLNKEVARLERTAATPEGEKAVIKRIAADFKVPEDAVRSLRGSGLGYGDIVIVYTLARVMPGGSIGENVQKVVADRQGPPVRSWADVAKQARTKLGKAVTQLKKISNESHREMKQDHAKSATPPQKTPETPPEPAPGTKKFEGEGKSMTRGGAAQ